MRKRKPRLRPAATCRLRILSCRCRPAPVRFRLRPRFSADAAAPALRTPARSAAGITWAGVSTSEAMQPDLSYRIPHSHGTRSRAVPRARPRIGVAPCRAMGAAPPPACNRASWV